MLSILKASLILQNSQNGNLTVLFITFQWKDNFKNHRQKEERFGKEKNH